MWDCHAKISNKDVSFFNVSLLANLTLALQLSRQQQFMDFMEKKPLPFFVIENLDTFPKKRKCAKKIYRA